MLVQNIIKYMASNKRLIVPQLGAFISKPDGSILFSEMLRTDDGVLRGLLCVGGMNEVEAAGLIDRFVFEVRHAVQQGSEYTMDGFGILRGGPNGTIVFMQGVPKVPEAPAAPRSASETARPAYETPNAKPKISTSVKMNPEPYVKGLRYGKPEKSTNAYTYVSRTPRRKGFDKLLLLAIVAAVIALAAIAYGYIRESLAESAESEYVEPAAANTPPAEEPTILQE